MILEMSQLRDFSTLKIIYYVNLRHFLVYCNCVNNLFFDIYTHGTFGLDFHRYKFTYVRNHFDLKIVPLLCQYFMPVNSILKLERIKLIFHVATQTFSCCPYVIRILTYDN